MQKGFNFRLSGLLDQLLSLVVLQERPDLEEARSALIVSSAQMKRDLKDIEDRILHKLSVSEGSAVDDIDLILTLEASKVKSEEIKVIRTVSASNIRVKPLSIMIHTTFNIIMTYQSINQSRRTKWRRRN